jgi:hypothetical protein
MPHRNRVLPRLSRLFCLLRMTLLRVPAALGAGCALYLAACFTEVGNPGKTQQINATFSIDYGTEPAPLPKSGAASTGGPPSVQILQFHFNVVEANYRTTEDVEGRIWKVPDSMGSRIDFTGKDSDAVLPAVRVPIASWTILKLESRIPRHIPLDPDTLDFGKFDNGGYIQGVWDSAGTRIPFLCQLPDVPKVNLVYEKESLEVWRHGDVYDLEFIFFASKWISAVSLAGAVTMTDKSGTAVALIDLEHNPEMFQQLKTAFFKPYKSFNSYKVWKEGSFPEETP